MGRRDNRSNGLTLTTVLELNNCRNGITRPLKKQVTDEINPTGIVTLNDNQALLLQILRSKIITAALGPAGTGKTYLPVTAAVEAFNKGGVKRIILSRPAVEAGGEKLGFLPGDANDKMAPFMRPIYDEINAAMGVAKVKQCMASGQIEIAPLAFMRGRTLKDAFVILDEAQNCTYSQLKMFLTRLGKGSRIAICGDPDQSDLDPGLSGLADMVEDIEGDPDVGVVRFSDADVVRHPTVGRLLGRMKGRTSSERPTHGVSSASVCVKCQIQHKPA